ncbi:L,D-transpeptidase family protein [Neorhizobium galegae]|uniref:L,D-transpeptidase family protein n=1 Tax=Neorhizobium galegae TaxID=399 RepID=UPI0006225559|nr:L,D-transpeptidase [Neorhizobium galegae]CDZ59210.1 ErfK/YbiS/YcfS/YnhG family protein [Neorhizobium galegae bv. orientalis]KAB1123334.1 L,D-transpeptidase [Neorhizobium galegae]MCQ1807112.1 L,D-transpeptidase [Neorhizobium galegae]MCQ1837299.1 L,D-transpeptidase [Neorhizobium galegae]UIY29324.1 L,D-transpeptidase [Neorhizobium galegae]
MQRFREGNHKKTAVVTVRTAPRDRSRAIVSFGGITVPAALGRSGTSPFKREGDGATPIAAMRLLNGYVRGDRVTLPPTPLSITRIGKDLLWCDQPEHPSYNRPVKAPFRPSHEEMMRVDGLYDICLVLDWNVTSRARNRGSAIFFHLIKPGYQPTAGCIAVSLADMKRLLRFMRKGTVVRVLG